MGQSGTVTILASDVVTFTGQGSGAFTSATGNGLGENITVNARQVQLAEGARIEARSTGADNAGNITITVQDTFISENSVIRTDAEQADGGNIILMAGNLIQLRNSEVSAQVGGGEQTIGGNITIAPAFAVIQNSRVLADAQEGQGGNIQITAQEVVLVDPLSVLDASSELGIDGSVDIQAPVTDLSGTVAPLQPAFASASALLQSRCAQRVRGEGILRFFQAGRNRLPNDPGGVLPSPLSRAATPVAQPAWPRRRGHRRPPIPAVMLAELQRGCVH